MPFRTLPMTVPDDGRMATIIPILEDPRVQTFAALGELLIYRSDFETGEIIWIPSLLERWGYAPEEIEATVQWYFGITHPDDVSVLVRFLDEAIAGLRTEWDLRYRIRRADGTWAHVQGRARLLRGESGKPIGTEGVIRDVSDVAAAEEALRQSEQNYRLLTENSRELICRHDPDGTYRYVSPAVRELAGWEPDELLRKNPYEFFHPDDRERIASESHTLALRGELDRVGIVYRFLCKDGSYIWLETLTRPILDASSAVIALQTSSRNVSERKALQDRLSRAQRLEAIGTLAGGVAHDFNSLLTVVRGNTELLLEDAKDAHTRESLEEMRYAVQRATALTRQLLILGRQELPTGRHVNLTHTVRALEPVVARVAGARARVSLDVADDCWVNADEAQLEQLVLNLVSNARDAMPEGGELVVSCHSLHLEQERQSDLGSVPAGQWVRLAVQDEGVGMSAEVLAHALDPFFTTKPVGQGTGLGLPTMQRIVQSLNGHVTIDSALGRGTTVACWLPPELERADDGSSVAETTSAEEDVRPLLLVVDDEPLVRAVAQRILERHGYRVVTADDGATALEKLDAGLKPSLVLTDVMMPVMSGRALAEAMQARGMPFPILFMSGFAREDLLADGQLGQELTLVHKPFSLKDLLAAVREGLRSASAE